jgi:transposase-like protein
LSGAIRSYAGEAAFLQRCQIHKIRNMVEYLPEGERHAVKFRMRAAYLKDTGADARNAFWKLLDELMEVNPSAAGSLAEGLEDTLTLLTCRSAISCGRACPAPTVSNLDSRPWNASAAK